MISFFRKIRQKLLSENRVTRYLAYAVGEILLVVIGILIALQVNTWNENRKKLAVSRETIVNLKAELEEANVELERAYHFNRENRRLSQEFIDGEISLDSLA